MIYIYCPAHIKTGGTEVLHQLSHKLNLLGFSSGLVLYNIKEDLPLIPEDFLKYQAELFTEVVDSDENIVIVPEVLIDALLFFKNCKRIIWWLSVNNASFKDDSKQLLTQDPSVIHLVQSEYAREYVETQWNIPASNIFYLSDYISSEFINIPDSFEDIKQHNIVVFNPNKGRNHALELIGNSDAHILWRPLKGLTSTGMMQVLKEAKIYIDLGAHPGKDRIPREAALCGCCVVTNRLGSAKNTSDVSIPEKYKLENSASPDEYLNILYEILEDFPGHTKDFDDYRKKTQLEFLSFEHDISLIFNTILNIDNSISFNQDQLTQQVLTNVINGRYKEAFQDLVRYHGNNFESTFLINLLEAYTRYNLDEYGEALYFSNIALEFQPDNSEVMLLLSKIHLSLKNYNLALKFCNNALKFSAGQPDEQEISLGCKEIIASIKKCL